MPDYEHCCKVGRTADKYDLSPGSEGDLNSYLAARWLGRDGYPETALRPLTDWFHTSILVEVYTEYGRNTIETRVDSDYEALTGDDDERRKLVIEDMETDGIDGRDILDDFVSPPTLYRHLTNCLDLEKTSDTGDGDSEWEQNKLEYTRQVARENVEDVLRSWENKGEVPNATQSDISVRLYVECPVCLTQVDIDRAHRRGYVCDEHMIDVDKVV